MKLVATPTKPGKAPRDKREYPKKESLLAQALFFCFAYTSSMTAISAASPRRVPMRVMRV